jgi:hypothetical protein
MATLAAIVHVVDEDGVSHAFTPADEVPAWAASKITNPKAWAEAPSTVDRPTGTPARKTAAKRAPARRKAVDGATVQRD